MRPTIINMGAALFAVCASSPALSKEGLDWLYCADRSLGVYFYCERQEEMEPVDSNGSIISSGSLSATEQVDQIRKRVEEARAVAVLRPTPQNVAAYIRIQREQLDRASLFTDVWRRVLWAQPELDYTLERPVGQLAKQVWLAERSNARTNAVTSISERYGLFYFFSSTCGACLAFSPVLRAFADAHGLTVRAVSVDGGPSVYFPDAIRDQGQMRQIGLGDAPTPAVVLFDTETREVLPVAFGIVSAADLADRIFLLTTTEAGDDL